MYVDKNTFDEEELEGYEGFTMLFNSMFFKHICFQIF